MKKNIEDYSEDSQNLLQQRCATRGPLANTGEGAEIFVVRGKGQILKGYCQSSVGGQRIV